MGEQRNALILLLLLISLIVSIPEIEISKAENFTIIINADGSISPSNAPMNQSGNVYSLTEDVKGRIIVKNNNLVLDGKYYTLTPPSITADGISLHGVSNVTVIRFRIIGGAIGIKINGRLNTVANNTIEDVDNGIYGLDQPSAAIALQDASSNIITMNNLENNRVGITLTSYHRKQCNNNLIVENSINQSTIAIGIYDSSNNSFHHNNFFDNVNMMSDKGYYAFSLPSFNIWDDGCQFGNYWSDYLIRYPHATENDSTGVGDTPYFVKPSMYVDPSTLTRQEAIDYWTATNARYEINTDNFPLMKPVDIPEFQLPDQTSPPIYIDLPENKTYTTDRVTLNLTVDEETSWMGYSLDGQDNVTLTESTINLTELSDGPHNLMVYATDTAGNTGISDTVYFTIAVSDIPIEPITTSVMAVVAIAVASILIYYTIIKRNRGREELNAQGG